MTRANRIGDLSDCAPPARHPVAAATRTSGSVTFPAREPLGQRTGFAETGKSVVDGIVVAPYRIGKGAVGDLRWAMIALVLRSIGSVWVFGRRQFGQLVRTGATRPAQPKRWPGRWGC